MGKDLVYVVNRPENEDTPFITYFQVYEGTVFVITLHINEKKCIATMQVKIVIVEYPMLATFQFLSFVL